MAYKVSVCGVFLVRMGENTEQKNSAYLRKLFTQLVKIAYHLVKNSGWILTQDRLLKCDHEEADELIMFYCREKYI